MGIQAAWGDYRVMVNWFPMCLKEVARAWLINEPPHEVHLSWKDLSKYFFANFMAT
jgi:hypothetical protein